MGSADPHRPTFATADGPERPAGRGGRAADQLPEGTGGLLPVRGRRAAGPGRQASPAGPACSPAGRGGRSPESPRPTGETKAPRRLELPFGRGCSETSSLPWLSVMLCDPHRQSCGTESASSITGARKADQPRGPRGQRRGAGGRAVGTRLRSGSPPGRPAGLPGGLRPGQRHGLLGLVCCAGVSSSKTQGRPGPA